MVQVTARLPDALGAELDAAAQQLNRCRADIIRQQSSTTSTTLRIFAAALQP